MMKLQDCSASLNYLSIIHCVNLNLTILLGSGSNYQCLTQLLIQSCDDLESFGLPTPNLRHLDIVDCQHLKSLPERMDLLSSLWSLWVNNCASLLELFPQEKLITIRSMLHVHEFHFTRCLFYETFKLAVRKAKKEKKAKDPHKTKRPPSAFFVFMRKTMSKDYHKKLDSGLRFDSYIVFVVKELLEEAKPTII
ncbi:Copper transport protein ATX1 [Olea europaea subsp. europaea]|uniref:Copper transport protein ATX1 n=1 Tax=Olea europaea subsp. europaea TaxID=158383 RepID=A0A8S0VGL4_OLEEU|nr:Copper transport protein ATX1 [Olea europaea subsp. europaea]